MAPYYSRRTYGPQRRGGFPVRRVIAAVMALGGLFTWFTATQENEVTGEVHHVRLSQQDEVALGLEAASQLARQHGGEVEDPELRAYVAQVGQRVVQQSGASRGKYPYDFHVLSDPETVNAFALPGGQVFITVGLLERLTSEAELAAVLGHEIGHVVGRHGVEHLAKAGLTPSLVGAVAIGAKDSDDPHGQRTARIAAAVGQLMDMKFGREDELESDALGVRFMKEAGYAPSEMGDLMRVLGESAGGGRPPEFFSTHPNPENRLEKIDELVAQNGGPGGDVGEEAFRANVLQRLGRSGAAQEPRPGVGGSGQPDVTGW